MYNYYGNTTPIYASVNETSKIVGISAFYLRQRIANKEIVFVNSGNKMLINIPLLLQQLENESRKDC